jgi:methylenetetrahydrofolate dehydrogenase (NADP+) / methenyltetrahydrofolate cyclohydrolase
VLQLDGRAMAAELTQELKAEAAALHDRGVVPTLAVVLIGDDQAAQSYLRSIRRTADAIDVRWEARRLAADAGAEALLALVDELDADPGVHGVIVQSPLPPAFGGARLDGHLRAVKDVDGATTASAGTLVMERGAGHVPATAAAVIELLDRARVPIRGAHAVVIGRSPVVGKPAALLLLNRDATVTVCHLETRDVPALARTADILIVAIGDPHFIGPEYVKPGAVVVDVGINFVDGHLVGDVDFDAVLPVAGAVTPVPGGVGPLTTTMLLRNVLRAAQALV